ncbi:MAG: Thioredoxin reductase [Myxococcaceae bacterium]|nr:Thioredoxin reductase [Myxococcaceae bacterium]
MSEAPADDGYGGRGAQMFPRLTAAQVARLRPYGRERRFAAGATVWSQGQEVIPFYIVLEGRLAVVQPAALSGCGENVITVHDPGQFTGEVNMISGHRSLVDGRAETDCLLLELPRERLLALVQTDAELSEVFLRAFILRRTALIAHDRGDVVLIGSRASADTLRAHEFLTRNGHPHIYLELEGDPAVGAMLACFHLRESDVPIVICRGEKVLKKPTNAEIAECLGLNAPLDPARVRDVVVVGAGPAGLAAAVYAASEGLDALVIEGHAPGGQAGSSSKIENYLGFPTGISGHALAARALVQAEKFGATLHLASEVVAIDCERRPYRLTLSSGATVQARAVVIATGAEYRKPDLPDLARYEGAGVYYGATHLEAQLCGADEVIVVGGGNSAGQAAMFLSRTARHVSVFVRGAGLAESMSRYLVRRIEESPNVTLHTRTQIEALAGDGHLEAVTFREGGAGPVTRPVRHVFLMTGARPNTAWLGGCAALDAKGFVRTGDELGAVGGWPLARRPFLMETSLPGVFAVGDVRAGSVKRVASAVGEGSVCIQLVHRAIAEVAEGER